MSWSVSASGAANKVAVQLEQQFANINCSDPGEQTTVQNVRALVAQTLSTIDPDKWRQNENWVIVKSLGAGGAMVCGIIAAFGMNKVVLVFLQVISLFALAVGMWKEK